METPPLETPLLALLELSTLLSVILLSTVSGAPNKLCRIQLLTGAAMKSPKLLLTESLSKPAMFADMVKKLLKSTLLLASPMHLKLRSLPLAET